MTLFSLIIVLQVKLDYFNFNNKKAISGTVPKIASELINYRLPCSEDHQISCLLVA